MRATATAAASRSLSVVVPVFNEEEVLPELHERLDDGARRTSRRLRGRLRRRRLDRRLGRADRGAGRASADDVVLVQLSRNFGMEIAMSAGLDHARGDYVVLMHADLQDPPELIPDMLAARARRAGRRRLRAPHRARREPLKRMLATGFYAMMRAPRARALPGPGGRLPADVAARRSTRCATMPERRRFLRGMVAWVGFEQVPIEYRRAGRHGRRRRVLPGAVPARARGDHVVLRRAAAASPPTSARSARRSAALAGVRRAGAAR